MAIGVGSSALQVSVRTSEPSVPPQEFLENDDPFFPCFTPRRVSAIFLVRPPFEAREGAMSADLIHVVVTIGIIAVMFAWGPVLHIICPSAWRAHEPPKEKQPEETRQQKDSVAPESSQRLAKQSRDFLHALSTRGPDSRAGGTGVPPGSCAE